MSLLNPPSHCINPLVTELGFETAQVNLELSQWLGAPRPNYNSGKLLEDTMEEVYVLLAKWGEEGIDLKVLHQPNHSMYKATVEAIQKTMAGWGGYDTAKALESHGFSPDSTLVELLDDLYFTLKKLQTSAEECWAKANPSVFPKIGSTVTYKSHKFSPAQTGTVIQHTLATNKVGIYVEALHQLKANTLEEMSKKYAIVNLEDILPKI